MCYVCNVLAAGVFVCVLFTYSAFAVLASKVVRLPLCPGCICIHVYHNQACCYGQSCWCLLRFFILCTVWTSIASISSNMSPIVLLCSVLN